MPVSTPYKPLDLFKVAKFIARISGAKEIGEPPFQVALDFFKPLDAEDSQRQTIPGELPTATQVILSAHDSFPTMPLSDAMRQMRKDMEQEGTQFEVVDNAVLPSDLNAGFVRQLVRGMEQASQSEWDATWTAHSNHGAASLKCSKLIGNGPSASLTPFSITCAATHTSSMTRHRPRPPR